MPPTTTTLNGVTYRYKKTGAIPTPEELERLANDVHRARNSLAYAEQQLERVVREATQRRHEVEACQEQYEQAQCWLLDRLAGWEMVEVAGNPGPPPDIEASAERVEREVGWVPEASVAVDAFPPAQRQGSRAQEARQEATGRLQRGERDPS